MNIINYAKIYLPFFLLIIGAMGIGYVANKKMNPCPSAKTAQLNTALRALWAEHVVWTRDYIIAAVANAADKKAATDRLLKNQVDLGDAIVPFYGKEAGTKLTELLKEHIMIAANVVQAAQENNTAKLNEENKKWHQNADDIATFLSSANPYWPKQDLVTMLNNHLALTTDEAVARIKKDWNADITAFDKVFEQALHMADMFTQGIAQQFPDKA